FAHNSLTAHQVPITNTDRARAFSIKPSTEPPTERYIPTTHVPTSESLSESEEHLESESDSSDYYDSYGDYESEEDFCNRNQYYHVRGRQCVPIKCPRGNHLRNDKTGECLFTAETDIKRFGNHDGRMGYKHRNVLRRYKTYTGRGRSATHWGMGSQRTRVPIDTDTPNPIRTIGLIG
ncbi:hypothetical protein Ocin01_12944, partial [Orchesella cincta]